MVGWGLRGIALRCMALHGCVCVCVCVCVCGGGMQRARTSDCLSCHPPQLSAVNSLCRACVLLPRSYAVEAHVPAGVQVAAEVLRHVEPDSELLAQRLYATCAELELPTLQAEVAKVRGPCWCLRWCVCGVVPACTRGGTTHGAARRLAPSCAGRLLGPAVAVHETHAPHPQWVSLHGAARATPIGVLAPAGGRWRPVSAVGRNRGSHPHTLGGAGDGFHC